MTDRIEQSVTMHAPIERVWRALTDYQEFGTWFRVKLEGPFALGEVSTGHTTYPGYEHLKGQARIERMEAPRLFAFTWHPYAIDPDKDYSTEPSTLVEFRLEPAPNGTHLTIVESGFDALPPGRRDEAVRMNEGGWAIQADNIKSHVDAGR